MLTSLTMGRTDEISAIEGVAGAAPLTLPREVAATAALLPEAEHESFAGAGHSLLLESVAAFDRVVAFARA